MRILFTPTGRRQFLEAITFIHRDKPSAAVSFRKKAEKTLVRLKKFPESGRLIPEIAIRQMQVLTAAPAVKQLKG